MLCDLCGTTQIDAYKSAPSRTIMRYRCNGRPRQLLLGASRFSSALISPFGQDIRRVSQHHALSVRKNRLTYYS